MGDIKKKSKTSAASVNKYIKKTYKRLNVLVKKEDADRFILKCSELGIPYSRVLADAISDFMRDQEQGQNSNN